ncbi:MAG: T9SS type A sorting domain-containing protein, partial [bacterium]|nr:T9SS type A sorting domain-containing protein [bacterium]
GVNTGKVVTNVENNVFSMPSVVKNDSKISFTLKSNTEVSISLYDVTGRMVKSLANGSFTKGNHTINMNSNDFNQGVYFVKVNAGDTSVSKKVIVVK